MTQLNGKTSTKSKPHSKEDHTNQPKNTPSSFWEEYTDMNTMFHALNGITCDTMKDTEATLETIFNFLNYIIAFMPTHNKLNITLVT